MKAIKHLELEDTTYAAAVKSIVAVTELADLTGRVPHVGYGGAAKSCYVSPKTGKTIYVLERNGLIAPDSYINDVWLFDSDFSDAEAAAFLAAIDKARIH